MALFPSAVDTYLYPVAIYHSFKSQIVEQWRPELQKLQQHGHSSERRHWNFPAVNTLSARQSIKAIQHFVGSRKPRFEPLNFPWKSPRWPTRSHYIHLWRRSTPLETKLRYICFHGNGLWLYRSWMQITYFGIRHAVIPLSYTRHPS